jgi:hypothetical protein
MKTITSTILASCVLLATAAAGLSTSATYKLKISSTVPALKDATLVLKDASSANSSPNALGSFSSGEPRYPYTLTLSAISEADKLYELIGTVKQTHLILNGDSRAPQLFDVPIGADPAAEPGNTLTRSRFLLVESGSRLNIVSAEDTAGSGNYRGAGTWRACNGSTVDYQMYWFDGKWRLLRYVCFANWIYKGLSNLTAIIPGYGCESVGLYLEEVVTSVSKTAVNPSMTTGNGFVGGVGAPKTTATGFLTSVPAPGGNVSRTSVVSPEANGAAAYSAVTEALIGLTVGFMAALL